MVKIINGEIVPDNDPRAKAYARQSQSSSSKNRIGSIRGLSQSGGNGPPQGSYGQGANQSGQMFATQPGRSSSQGKGLLGLPMIHLFGVDIIPEVYLGLALVAFLAGIDKALMLAAVFFCFKWYQDKTRGENAVPFMASTSSRPLSSSSSSSSSSKKNTSGVRLGGESKKRKGGIRTLHDT
mmetsp:Transcript_5858/g.7111  ORF Transcript_5858/g.7111 Transcript_5858/m.7111 type:complete len:181 (+) Transcript_5858:64-606(+)